MILGQTGRDSVIRIHALKNVGTSLLATSSTPSREQLAPTSQTTVWWSPISQPQRRLRDWPWIRSPAATKVAGLAP
jgi:hypothetical protein